MTKFRYGLICVPLLALGLGACDVDQTQEGELPEVDVQAEGGQMPAYDVEGPDVSVESERRQVTVPDVEVQREQATVTVPDVDVDLPEDEEQAQEEPAQQEPRG